MSFPEEIGLLRSALFRASIKPEKFLGKIIEIFYGQEIAPVCRPLSEDDEESEPEFSNERRVLVNLLQPSLDEMPRHLGVKTPFGGL